MRKGEQNKPVGRPRLGPHVFVRSGRFYADVRDFRDVLTDGERSGRLALKLPDQGLATTDRQIADVLFARLLEDLQARRMNKVTTGRAAPVLLEQYAAKYLVRRAKAKKVVPEYLAAVEVHLREAAAFFGGATSLEAIRPTDIARYVEHLATLRRGRRGPGGERPLLSTATQRKYLNSLSSLYRYAISDGLLGKAGNPVAALVDKPTGDEHEARWLEVAEAALLLEACRTYRPFGARSEYAMSGEMLHALVAVFLLTGARAAEGYGLTVGDVSFERGRVTFRTHPHRRLKTRTSARSVPLWPQLREILIPYIASLQDQRTDALLFPAVRGGGMIRGIFRLLDVAAGRVGWRPGEIRVKALRHTYCTTRLRCYNRILRRGPDAADTEVQVPVSRDEVARELGHGGTSLVERVYGHLSESAWRGEYPEYRVENHRAELAPRLGLLRVA
jgi:integrase